MSEMKNDALSIQPMISFSVREARSVSLRRGKKMPFAFHPDDISSLTSLIDQTFVARTNARFVP